MLVALLAVLSTSPVTVGADVRERYETILTPDWGRAPADENGYWMQRASVHVDARAGAALRAFLELSSSVIGGREGGPRPTDEDVLDVHQGFVDVGGARLSARLGRQELQLGSARLISVNDGPNIRRAFDGVDVHARAGSWQLDALALLPVTTKRGAFDDLPSGSQRLWGLFATALWPSVSLAADVYYLGLLRPQVAFDQGTANELRHTVGARVWGHAGGLSGDVEGAYQLGAFGGADIRAWMIASRVQHERGPVRVALQGEVTSGDRGQAAPTLQTFNPLFPRTSYFALIGFIGPMNVAAARATLDFSAGEKLAVGGEATGFLRESVADGVYGPAGTLLIGSLPAAGRFIGSQWSANLAWHFDERAIATLVYARFITGSLLTRAGLAEAVDYVGGWLTFRI